MVVKPRVYDTEKEWLGACEAGALLAELTGLTRKSARRYIRGLTTEDGRKLYPHAGIVVIAACIIADRASYEKPK